MTHFTPDGTSGFDLNDLSPDDRKFILRNDPMPNVRSILTAHGRDDITGQPLTVTPTHLQWSPPDRTSATVVAAGVAVFLLAIAVIGLVGVLIIGSPQ